MTVQDKQAWYDEMIELFSNDERFPYLEKACLLILECVDDEEEWTPYHFNILKQYVRSVGYGFKKKSLNPYFLNKINNKIKILNKKLDITLLSKKQKNIYYIAISDYKLAINNAIKFHTMYYKNIDKIDKDEKKYLEQLYQASLETYYFDHLYVKNCNY